MSSATERGRFRVRRADWDKDQEAVRLVRQRVFVEEQGVPADLEWDGEDERALHHLALDPEDHPIGTVRLLPTGQIGRMAVIPVWRGRGVGKALLRAALADADRAEGPTTPFLHAQVSALSFYADMGFTAVGEEFTEAGIPHRRMVLTADGAGTGPDLSRHLLGQTRGTLQLDTRDGVRGAGLLLATQAQRELHLFSRDLDPMLYDNGAFLLQVRRIMLRGREVPVRILLFNVESAIRQGHRLIEAARQTPSKIQIRRVPTDFHAHTEAYLLADSQGYLLRRFADVLKAQGSFNDPKEVRHLRDQFEQIWQRAQEFAEVRSFGRGL